MLDLAPKEGSLVRSSTTGQFIAGNTGGGRPKGSKNKISIYKLATEEAFRQRNSNAIDAVLDLIVADALEGNTAARKLVWDACVSKSTIQDDKNAGAKQEITVHRMIVVKDDKDVDDNLEKEEDNE